MLYFYLISILLILNGNDCHRIQRRHPLMRYREVECMFSNQNPIEIDDCNHGFYSDRCQRRVCYKGLYESCNHQTENGLGSGMCAPGLICDGCGRCVGCINEKECMLELQQCNHGSNVLMKFDGNSNSLSHSGRTSQSNSIRQIDDDNESSFN